MVFDRELTCLAADGAASLPVFSWRPEGLESGLASLDPAQAAFLRATGFAADAGEIALLPGSDGIAAAVLGLGDDRSPYPHGALPLGLPEGTAWRLEPGDFDMAGAVLGFCLGAYQFDAYKRPKRTPALLAGAGWLIESLAMARATWLVRDLINTPANHLGPAELADAVALVARRFGAAAERIEAETLQREYPTIAAVGAGSERAPVVARFAWQGSRANASAPLVSLCGKGVCFDTGGYDLKPSAAMLRMKKDMGGAALMLGLAAAVMQADLPVRLELRIGCVENMVSGRAMRPARRAHDPARPLRRGRQHRRRRPAGAVRPARRGVGPPPGPADRRGHPDGRGADSVGAGPAGAVLPGRRSGGTGGGGIGRGARPGVAAAAMAGLRRLDVERHR